MYSTENCVLFVQTELANVGPLYKLRVRHDNSKSFSDWHLEKVLCRYGVVTINRAIQYK